ncbi:MAG: DUF4412 domain-containing protein [Thermodesulfobacteriota bacterium]
MKSIARILTAFALVVCGLASAQAADFTADMTQTLNGTPLLTGKASVKEGMVRMESTVQGVPQVVISVPDKGRMIMLQPQMKMYMETRVDPAKMGPDVMKDGGEFGKWRVVGREKHDGMDCEKRVFDFKDKSQGEMTAWFADKLDYPVKTVFVNGKDTMVVEYKNIKEAALDKSLFEVPPGYQRMNIPDMGQGAGKMPGK